MIDFKNHSKTNSMRYFKKIKFVKFMKKFIQIYFFYSIFLLIFIKVLKSSKITPYSYNPPMIVIEDFDDY